MLTSIEVTNVIFYLGNALLYLKNYDDAIAAYDKTI